MNFKKIIRFILFILVIALASVLPLPISFYTKDNLPKHLIEIVDKKDDDDDDEIKVLF